jgi:hypothetical protein
MKIKTVFVIAGVLLLISCASQPFDLGIHNPENIPEDELVTLYIHHNCRVQRVDNTLVDWLSGKYNTKIIKIPPGQHTIFTRFDNGESYTRLYVPVTGQFEKGNAYLLSFELARNMRVEFNFHLYNEKKETTNVTIKPTGDEDLAISSYFNFVLTPALRGNSVKLENEKYILTYKPNNVFTLTDKETSITTEGSYEFPIYTATRLQADRIGKVFLFEMDFKTLSRKQSFVESAHTIFLPISSTETEVIYLYEKPSELWGTEIIFDIKEIYKL